MTNLHQLTIPQLQKREEELTREWDRLDSQGRYNNQVEVERQLKLVQDMIAWKRADEVGKEEIAAGVRKPLEFHNPIKFV